MLQSGQIHDGYIQNYIDMPVRWSSGTHFFTCFWEDVKNVPRDKHCRPRGNFCRVLTYAYRGWRRATANVWHLLDALDKEVRINYASRIWFKVVTVQWVTYILLQICSHFEGWEVSRLWRSRFYGLTRVTTWHGSSVEFCEGKHSQPSISGWWLTMGIDGCFSEEGGIFYPKHSGFWSRIHHAEIGLGGLKDFWCPVTWVNHLFRANARYNKTLVTSAVPRFCWLITRLKHNMKLCFAEKMEGWRSE